MANKSLGQHWLFDEAVLEEIADIADPNSRDTILEIGPGLGTLTKILSKKVEKVVAVELDAKLAKELPSRVGSDNLVVYHQDILTFDLTTLPSNYKIVANIPYYLTSKLIRVISDSKNPPLSAVLLLQKEVAERVGAKPGEMSLLSVSAQYYWEISLGRVVPAALFSPPPKVDSRVLLLKRRSEAPFPDADNQLFFRVVKAGFSSRRKTLQNSLSGGLRISKVQAKDVIETAGLDTKLRPQALSLSDWNRLYEGVHQLMHT